MKEKLTNDEKHWKKYKEKRNNGITLAIYCLIFAGMGAIMLLGGLSQQTMYLTLKDDEFLTDDGLAYRDMANATYTFPVAEIDELVESSYWLIAMGAVMVAASLIVGFSVAWVIPEHKEIHTMLCKGIGEKEYCPECGLKLSKLEKD